MKNSFIPTVYPVACHTDNVGLGTTFVAIQGMKKNGIDYIPAALEKGARRIVVESDVLITHELEQQIQACGAELVRVANTRKALAELSAQALGYPAKKLKIIGITGTKGKTTTTFLLEHILRSSGKKTAMLSTVYNKIGDEIVATKLTTRQPDYLHVFFDACVKAGVEYVVMEVAAQAFTLYRVHGIEFDAAIFTNFSQEHGEFYASMEDYFAAKLQIVGQLKSEIFLEDQSATMAPFIVNTDLKYEWPSWYYGFNAEHAYNCPALIGVFNQYNIAAATSCAELLGLEQQQIQQTLDTFPGVPGRLEKYNLPNGALGIIDYAHNPSSFEAVLSELKKLTQQLIVVFGCGGERDSSKRPVMGKIASDIADLVVITSDNPRSENPQTIMEQIIAGIAPSNKNKVVIEEDRERAIRLAYEKSCNGSIIVLLGKGPDEYQIIQGVTYPFSEKGILKSL